MMFAMSDAVLVSLIGSGATLAGIVFTVGIPAWVSHRNLKKNVLGKPNGQGNIVQMLEASNLKLDSLSKEVTEVRSEMLVKHHLLERMVGQHEDFRAEVREVKKFIGMEQRP